MEGAKNRGIGEKAPMRVLLDTNVILDIALERQPYYAPAARIIAASDFDRMHLFITASMATDVYYILRKFKGREHSLAFLADLLSSVDVCQVDKSVLVKALDSGFFDFEDAVQNAAAIESRIDAIVTRNKTHYKTSPLTVLAPEGLVAMYLT
ncbi:MAG: PIN domain-containing protein [Pirellulales bacterium]|nr:PIN domain-containing protein [Pirellulales bacterium]